MRKKVLLTVCVTALMVACSQKQSVVSIPPSGIDVEKLIDSINYDMDVSGLSLADVRTLGSAPAATRGYPFKDAYLRSIYKTTSWYDSLVWQLDGQLPWDSIKSKDDEDWRDYYFRVIEESNKMNYSEQELAFVKRLKAREEELRKLNFEVPENLRVNMQNLANPAQMKDFDPLLAQKLGEAGFGIVAANHEQLFQVYESNDYYEIPSFVTTDLYLQLFHLYFDCMLRELEENKLIQLMTDFSQSMLRQMNIIYMAAEEGSTVKEAALRGVIFYKVADYLFTGKPVGANEHPIVADEVQKARNSENATSEFLLDYRDFLFAYGLFRPRGHYTRSEALQRYFRGMMWLQSAPMGMDNPEEVRQAVVMAFVLNQNKDLWNKYERLNKFITFLMGKHDNLSLPQVVAEVEKAKLPMQELLNNEQALDKIKKELERIGNEQTRIRPAFEKTSHNKICVMPQRYQPDAEVLLNMVDYKGDPTKRATPKGLDFFAAMGVTTAEQILMEEKSEWADFAPSLKKMKQRMSEIDWQETIATQWMNALKVLNDNDKDQPLPYFMENPEWDKKDLNAGLASWAELKHDAILYAKQPMGAECGGGGPPDPVVKGYVEPNVNFWKKAIELLNNTAELLKSEDLVTEKIGNATERLREEAEFLLYISEKELAGKALDDVEYDQISIIGSTFENISLDLVREPDQYLQGWDNVEGADKSVALVADVYTANGDNNPNKAILYEAVGNADELYVVVEIEGYLYLMRGAVLSYREFIQPINEQRLTDEEWQQQLNDNPRKGVPEWMKPIIVPLKERPQVNEEFFYSSGC